MSRNNGSDISMEDSTIMCQLYEKGNGLIGGRGVSKENEYVVVQWNMDQQGVIANGAVECQLKMVSCLQIENSMSMTNG